MQTGKMGMPSTQVTVSVAKAARNESIHFIQSKEFEIFSRVFLNILMMNCA